MWVVEVARAGAGAMRTEISRARRQLMAGDGRPAQPGCVNATVLPAGLTGRPDEGHPARDTVPPIPPDTEPVVDGAPCALPGCPHPGELARNQVPWCSGHFEQGEAILHLEQRARL